MKIRELLFPFLLMAILLNYGPIKAQDVDLGVTNVWPAIKGTVPDYNFQDQTKPYWGGYHYMPVHLFNGFDPIGLPVSHPGEDAITFDWQLTLTADPSGAANVVFDQSSNYTLSTGESDTILFGQAVNYQEINDYALSATLISANDGNVANNQTTFNYVLSDSTYGFADKDNLSGSFTLVDTLSAGNQDGVGIAVYFPEPAGDPHQVNSMTTYLKDDFTGVIENGNATFVGVVYPRNQSTGLWDLSSAIAQTNPKNLTSDDLNSMLTMSLINPMTISNESEYLFMLYIFNGNDLTDEGRITIANDPDSYAPYDLRCVLAIDGAVEYAEATPAIWVNVEPQQLPASSEAEILSYSFPNQITSEIDASNQTIDVTMPQGTDLTSLVADFTLSPGATAAVSGTEQVSGTTANDFTAPVVYTVTAEDGTTTKNWTVTVNVELSDATEIIDYSIPNQVGSNINTQNQTVEVTMPAGTDLTSLVADFTLSTGATATVDGTEQVSGTTANDFTNPVVYTVTAEDGTTTQDWTVTVQEAASNGTDILSYDIPGQESSQINSSEQTVDVVMPAGTDLTNLVAEFTLSPGATATVGGVEQVSGTTANDFTSPVVYTVTAEDDVTTVDWTVTVTINASNGTDILSYDIPGQESSQINASEQTIDVVMPAGTDLTNLVAEFTLSPGATATVGGVEQVSGTTANDFTSPVVYTVTAEDDVTTADWTVTVTINASSEADILTYTLPGQITSVINAGAQTVDVEVPLGTDLTSLVAEFTLSTGATATVSGVEQVSGSTPNDFTNPVQYTVTAQDGVTTKDWTVTVTTVASSETEILTYSIPDQLSADVNPVNQTVNVVMPMGTDLSALVADFTLSVGATASVEGEVQESGVTVNDFTNPVVYTITAQDGSTTADWTVTVSEQTISPADFISYSIDGQDGVIDMANAFVRVEMPAGTDITSLAATFEVADGTTVTVNGTVQESGVSVNDFTQIVAYRLTPADGPSKTWYVDVAVEGDMNNATLFEYFGFYGQTNPAEINYETHTIAVNLSPDLDVEALIPMFYLSDGAIAYIGSEIQWSGENIVDFSSPVTYTIVAENGTDTQDWTVQVTTNQNASAEILSYYFQDIPPSEQQTTIYNNSNSIYVDIPSGTPRDELVANFELSSGAVAKVDGVLQESGTTVNDFSTPVSYTVTSQNEANVRVWTVNVRYLTGIEANMDESFAIYPNPAAYSVHIKTPDGYTGMIMITDMNGKLHKVMQAGSDNAELDVTNMSSGVYFVVFRNGNKQLTRQMIVK
ncbi:T9SS type A sorting domain-containing protein [Salinivirga cyanobacteriivorans]